MSSLTTQEMLSFQKKRQEFQKIIKETEIELKSVEASIRDEKSYIEKDFVKIVAEIKESFEKFKSSREAYEFFPKLEFDGIKTHYAHFVSVPRDEILEYCHFRFIKCEKQRKIKRDSMVEYIKYVYDFFKEFTWKELFEIYLKYGVSSIVKTKMGYCGGAEIGWKRPRIEEPHWRHRVEEFIWTHHCSYCKTFEHSIFKCPKSDYIFSGVEEKKDFKRLMTKVCSSVPLDEYEKLVFSHLETIFRFQEHDLKFAYETCVCKTCTKFGHTSDFCCKYCRTFGHTIQLCPQIKDKSYCTYCAKYGHLTEKCRQKLKTFCKKCQVYGHYISAHKLY